ncbi:hypothetical protein C8P67_107250 [Flavobacterium aquicola]|uniref:Uncharacterized protein n=1 Tax=Flavobacterium aquicola TaxID=1682742 RepID=A0A3E0EJH3_9FLAO|nr:hypothetical protein C8P67_107250 [Flavobacterium aquicola]
MTLKKVKQNSSIYFHNQNRLYLDGFFMSKRQLLLQFLKTYLGETALWQGAISRTVYTLLAIMRSGCPGYFGSFLPSLSRANRNQVYPITRKMNLPRNFKKQYQIEMLQ